MKEEGRNRRGGDREERVKRGKGIWFAVCKRRSKKREEMGKGGDGKTKEGMRDRRGTSE